MLKDKNSDRNHLLGRATPKAKACYMHGRALALVKLHSELSSLLCLRRRLSTCLASAPLPIGHFHRQQYRGGGDGRCRCPLAHSLTQCGHLTLSAALAGVFPIKLIAPTNRPTNLPPLPSLPSYLTLHRFSPSISASKEISRL